MNEPPTPIEARLAGLKLRPLPASVPERVAAAMANKSHCEPRDWPLLGAIVSGAIAACVVITVLVTGESGPQPNRSPVVQMRPRQHTIAEQALASASPRWGDELNQLRDWRIP